MFGQNRIPRYESFRTASSHFPAAAFRRITARLTNAFSKKLENHEHAVALYFFAYNFLFRHATLQMPPALKAGVTDRWWTYEELVELIDRGGVENR